MIILSILQCILYLLIIPFGLGSIFTRRFDEKYNTAGNILVFGFISELAVFQVLFLLFYKLDRTLTELTWVSSVILFLISLVCIILFIVRKDYKRIKLPRFDLGFGVFVLFTVYMIVMRNLQGVNDGDDAFVIGNALTTYTNDVFYKVDYYTGFTITSDSFKRHLLASNPLFIAYLAKVTFIHPAILAHRVLGSFYLLLHNAVIYNISILLFEKGKEQYRSLFASFVSLLTIWDFHSFLTDSTFILSRTWQGKSMFCSLGIPLAILLLLMIGECKGKKNILFVTAVILAVSCIAMTPASIYLLTLFFVVGCVCVAFAVQKAAVVLKSLPMALSMAAVAALYMIYLN
ncbi:MAG: hypothetical protein J6X80_00035 [Lachnospiraceae bacterium]|nr:hypothetical protein [Lachnospiraceae bacterium]